MEFNELIKNFERIRTYMKDFFVYGFKSRSDYTQKSSRTYDNERRRIESYLKDYIQTTQTAKGKSVFICADGNAVFQNPLYAAWKSKSFTDNDIMLHFYIPSLLQSSGPMTAEALSDQISLRYGVEIDPQITRLKLKEYEKQQILTAHKDRKRLYYQLNQPLALEDSPVYEKLLNGISYFQETAPFGMIGTTILDRENRENKIFSFKHHFLMHTLDDGVLIDILKAIREQRGITFINKSYRNQSEAAVCGVPLKILSSTQTGRRYLCMFHPGSNRYNSLRLDSISKVKLLEKVNDYDRLKANLSSHLPKCWGVTFGGRSRLETIEFTIYINESTELYILDRLQRESRGGTITRLEKNRYLYTGHFYETNEASPWIKTFIGRITDIQGTNHYVTKKLKRDLEQMYQMYFGEEETDGTI